MARISAEDLQYHQFVLKRFQEAEAAKQQWFYYLAMKYQLQEGQVIYPDGEIGTKSPDA